MTDQKKEVKKGFFATLLEKIDKAMEAKAGQSSCCCSGDKKDGQDKKCC